MKRSRLKNKANNSKQPTDIASYKKQRNLVVPSNRQSKLDYFNFISSSKDAKPFWKQCKPYFSNKHAVGDSKIMLIENDKMILDNETINHNEIISHKQLIPSVCVNFLQNRVENMLTRLTILCQNSKLTRAL